MELSAQGLPGHNDAAVRPPSYTDQPPPEYAATNPPEYSIQPPTGYSNEPPPKYSDVTSNISYGDNVRHSTPYRGRGQQRRIGISAISIQEDRSSVGNVLNIDRLPFSVEQLGLARRDLSMLPSSCQDMGLAYRHDMNIRSQASSQPSLDETRRQLRDTGINIIVRDSNIGNDTSSESSCDACLVCLAICAVFCCILTGALAVFFARRRQKYLDQGNRSYCAAFTSGALAIVFIVISALFAFGCIMYIILSKN